jgi:hypothetical protein
MDGTICLNGWRNPMSQVSRSEAEDRVEATRLWLKGEEEAIANSLQQGISQGIFQSLNAISLVSAQNQQISANKQGM